MEKYDPLKYPKYDNYDAIEVSKVKDIPRDYDGVMGVPITFLDKFNPDQFEVLGITNGRYDYDVKPSKKYINPIQVGPNGEESNGSKMNTRSTVEMSEKPNGIFYRADNSPRFLKIVYARILIKNKKVRK